MHLILYILVWSFCILDEIVGDIDFIVKLVNFVQLYSNVYFIPTKSMGERYWPLRQTGGHDTGKGGEEVRLVVEDLSEGLLNKGAPDLRVQLQQES